MSSTVLMLVRYAVFGAFALAVLIAVASWLVRTRRVSPFSTVGKTMRQATDPLMRPIERRVVRSGGNPIQAGWWLVIGIAILGVLVVSIAQWLVGAWFSLQGAAHGGPRDLVVLIAVIAFDVLYFAIFVRVIASWLGAFRFSRWMRPAYWLTDWIIEPIRRLMPATGMIDLSPLVALLVLWLLKRFVFSVLL
jgi:YggT family protein